jgi:phosphomannomutase
MRDLISEDLEIHQDCIFGSLGFSFTATTLGLLSRSIYSYCTEAGINKIVLGYDSSEFTKMFSLGIVAKTLTALGLDCYYIDHPCPLFQLSWLTYQCTVDEKGLSKLLGLYLSSDAYYPEKLSIHFRHDTGRPFSEQEVASLAQHPFDVQLDEKHLINESLTIPLDISLYTQYLSDKKIANINSITSQCTVDVMFGATTELVSGISGKLENPTLSSMPGVAFPMQAFNKETTPGRLKHYVPNPTGQALSWGNHTRAALKNYALHAGFSHDGTAIGIWDPKQKLEISQSGVFCILLYHAAKILKKKGTILVSKAASDRVTLVAKGLGFNVEEIDTGTDAYVEAITKKRRSSALMYGDEKGRFWFKNDVLDFNCLVALLRVVDTCTRLKKSPGEVVDMLTEQYIDRDYIYSNLTLPRGILDKNELEDKLAKDFLVEPVSCSDKTSVYRLDTGVKIVIQENKKQSSVEVFIESENVETTKRIAKYVQNLFIANPTAGDNPASSVSR